MELVAATNNPDKLREIKEILGNVFEIKSLKEEGVSVVIDEDADTFLGNALKKARIVAELTGKPALADDSGLLVDAIDGAPGIYSARYAGEESDSVLNRAKLIRELEGESDRSAHFFTCVVLYYPDGGFITADGRVYGHITQEERGEGGFGYDSIFWSEELGKTFAEADPDEKNAVSHRGRALRALIQKLGEK